MADDAGARAESALGPGSGHRRRAITAKVRDAARWRECQRRAHLVRAVRDTTISSPAVDHDLAGDLAGLDQPVGRGDLGSVDPANVAIVPAASIAMTRRPRGAQQRADRAPRGELVTAGPRTRD